MWSRTERKTETRLLFHLMWPILITQFAQAGFGLIDTIMAGQLSASDLAVVAVGVGLWLPTILFLVGVMIATTPLVAAAKGANKSHEIPWITHQSLYLALGIGIIGFALLQLLPLTFNVLQIPANLQAKASFFLHAIAFGVPAVTLYATLRGYTEALGHPRPVTVISLMGLACSVPLNYVFMYGVGPFPALGGAGCGVATAIIQWFMLIILAIYLSFSKTYQYLRLFAKFDRVDYAMLAKIFALGAPIGMAIFFEVSLFSIAAVILSPLGETIVAAHQIALSVTSQLFMIPMALAMALTIRVGQLYGEKNWRIMRHVQTLGFRLATALACSTMLLIFFFRSEITTAYTSDPAVHHIAVGLLLFAMAYQIFDAWQVCAAGCLRGMQDTQGPMWITLLSYWGIALPLGILLSRGLHYSAPGFWTGLVIGLIVAACLLFLRLKRRQQQLFNLSAQPMPAQLEVD